MSLRNDLTKVFGANVIGLILSIVNGLFIPAFLSLDQYALLKIYALYVSYIGILHFGFIDGIHVKYGGKSINNIDSSVFQKEHIFLLILQGVTTLIFLLIGFITKDIVIILFSLSIIPINIQRFFMFFSQAIGNFNIYSKIKVLVPTFILSLNLLIILVLKRNSYLPFVLVQILTYYVILLYLEVYYNKIFKTDYITKRWDIIEKDFSVGIFIMLGNICSILFFSIDRWFVKFFLPIEEFAYYSFAISLMQIVTILISSVAITFYPYLAKENTEEKIKKIKNVLLVIGTISSGAYFVFSLVVNLFIKKYIPSLNVVSILFACFPSLAIINALYINLYKVKKKEKKYFLNVLLIVVIAIVLNVMAVLIYKTIQSIAVATMIAYYFWFFYSSNKFKGLSTSFKEIIYISLYIIIFIFSTVYLDLIIGFALFLFLIVALNYCFYKNEFRELILTKFLDI